jgi:hypothetical protein
MGDIFWIGEQTVRKWVRRSQAGGRIRRALDLRPAIA